MKGWVGLAGWPVADGLPTLVVTHRLQVERRTGKVRLSETDVLPLCYATNCPEVGIADTTTLARQSACRMYAELRAVHTFACALLRCAGKTHLVFTDGATRSAAARRVCVNGLLNLVYTVIAWFQRNIVRTLLWVLSCWLLLVRRASARLTCWCILHWQCIDNKYQQSLIDPRDCNVL